MYVCVLFLLTCARVQIDTSYAREKDVCQIR